jgi:hypothetical protein
VVDRPGEPDDGVYRDHDRRQLRDLHVVDRDQSARRLVVVEVHEPDPRAATALVTPPTRTPIVSVGSSTESSTIGIVNVPWVAPAEIVTAFDVGW